ncbi:MAG: hypothetical protein COB12_02280 [Flavobacterium sp.]|nr:MAG: hypothetical protein COB12_02280 [Flavobacterium sp.]
MKSLFETEAHNEITTRINNLTEASKAEWGKMNVGQMLTHCQKPFDVINGDLKMEAKIGFMKKFIFSLMKSVMYNDRPWRKNIPTGEGFVITEQVDFNPEREKLLNLVNEFSKKKNQTKWAPHPVFGKFTQEQYGKMNYKHLDHHLKQFGA